jgi:hypothetical protein
MTPVNYLDSVGPGPASPLGTIEKGPGGTNGASNTVNLHAMRVYAFKNTNLATLTANANKFLQGQAVTNVETGTVAYAATETRNRRYLGQEFAANGTEWGLLIFYAE